VCKLIEEFIALEMEYFNPIIARQKLETDEMRQACRNETVAQRLERISLETYDLCNGKVSQGLFEGLKLNRDTWWGKSDLGSQCLGFYEKDILDFIAAHGPFDTFLDIGAADGYYAIGMLHSQMTKRTICFEVSEKGQLAIKENWLINNSPGELEIHGEANEGSISTIASKVSSKSLVLIDIEGFEFSLLTPQVISLLKKCEVIIEIHHWVEDFPLKYKNLLKNLDLHFKVKKIKYSDRNTQSNPLLRGYTDDNRLLVTSERRPCLMRFLHLAPRL
jgi:hypothetical protein